MSETDYKRKIDRLSNLPPNVVDDILMLLPLRDAVRTCILSREWRYRWTSTPQLIFNQECAPTHVDGNDSDNLRRVRIVDKVLLCHKGPIHKFKCSEFVASCPDIDQWIVYLANHRIKEFILHLMSGKHSNHYQVPSRLFSCKDLSRLELTDCAIQMPPAFNGLANLRTLVLTGAKINDEALKHLVSKCRLLEQLRLRALDGITSIEIYSPNLKNIIIDSAFQGLHLSTPRLAILVINLRGEELMNEGHGCRLIKALGSLLSIRILWLFEPVLQFIPVGKTPQKLLPTYKQLKHLILRVNFTSFTQLAAACCFMASAPYLEKLRIYSTRLRKGSDEDKFDWEAHGCRLDCLRSMEMHKANGSENELGLLTVVLANAPLLSMMTVFSRTMSEDQETKILKRLFQIRQASPQVTIKCR